MADIAKFTEATVTELDTKLKDVRIPRANLGPCPVCGHDIMENRKGYSCWSREDPGCGFVIWKSKAGKQMPVAVARELIRTGRTEKPVTGFKGRSGKGFRARLALMQTEDGKWRVEFDEPWAKEGAKPPEAEEPAAAAGRGANGRHLRGRARRGLSPPESVSPARHHGRMPLTLVLGPANSAKAGEVLGAFATHSRREAVLVVPTLADVEHYRSELAAGGVVRGLILAPGGLAGEIARRAGREARVISDPVRRAVLTRALAEIEWDALQGSATGAGFAAAALSLVSELERGLITPQRFAAALRTWAGDDPRRAAYAREVGRIATGYARELERLGVEDAELFAWRALDLLRAHPASWGRTPVFFYGFDDLSRAERDAVETLARHVGAEVTVSLNYEPGREALAGPRRGRAGAASDR